MPTHIRVVNDGQFERIVMENESIRAVILPELGGKIASCVSLRSGREFLLQHPDRPYRRPHYADSFVDYDISGFDECLPTISVCNYPEPPFAGVAMPDHGEVWAMTWKYEIDRDELRMEVDGVALPYVFRRKVRLSAGALEMAYAITNTGDQPFKYLWSAHPLLAIEPGARIILPPEVSDVLVDYSTFGRFVIGGKISWPHARDANGNAVHLDTISGPAQKTADKLFTSRLSEGYCGLSLPGARETIFFRFDPQVVPYLGLWICQGGFPTEGVPEFTVGLEPCNARPDSLVTAIANGECPELLPRQTHTWALAMEIKLS